MHWKYDPGEKRKKHKWPKDAAGFLPPSGRNMHGQCPTSITRHPTLAEDLLNGGIPWPHGAEIPSKIYNIYKGVVYRAIPTVSGVSYHGFPEREKAGNPVSDMVPDTVLEELARRADRAGDYHRFKRWAREHLPNGWSNLKFEPMNP
jgi:hypothetical protein